MTDGALADALLAWCSGVLPELVGEYDYPPPRRTKGKPEAAVDVKRRALTRTDPRFMAPAQQQILDVRDCELLVAVKAEPAKEAIDTLRGFADRLLTALRADLSLGNAGVETGPPWEVDYSLGEAGGLVIFADDSEGRAFALRLGVCERIPEP